MIDIKTDTKRSRWKNQIRNLPITIDDINRAETIYGPQIPIIKGRAVGRRPELHFQHPLPTPPLPPTLVVFIPFLLVEVGG